MSWSSTSPCAQSLHCGLRIGNGTRLRWPRVHDRGWDIFFNLRLGSCMRSAQGLSNRRLSMREQPLAYNHITLP